MKFGSNYQALAHHWVHNFDNSECYGSRMFSEGNKIYSYGYHYIIAQKIEVKPKSGNYIFLINSNRASNTTSKQMWCVRSAIPSYYTKFEVPEAKLNHSKNIEYFLSELEDLCIKESRARSIDYKPEIRNSLNTLQYYIDLFPQDKRRWTKSFKQLMNFNFENDNINEIVELLTGIVNERVRVQKKKAKIASKKAIEKAKLQLKQWKNFETDKAWEIRNLGKNFLRYNKEKELIEVSNSSNITLEEALKFYKKVERGIRLLGETVDNYKVVKAGTNFTIGCTTLERDELNYACKQLELKEIF